MLAERLTLRTPHTSPVPVGQALRTLLYVAALLVFLAGVQLFLFPLRTERYFAWTIDSPMTATFLGASYWSSVGLELAAARARRWDEAVIALPAVWMFTTATLLVTLGHRDLFHFGEEHSLSTRLVTWVWLGIYVSVPVLLTLAIHDAAVEAPRTEGGDPRKATKREPDRPMPLVVRAGVALLAVILVAVALALLVAPQRMAPVWPWPLTRLTGRAIGAWALGLGVAAAHSLVLRQRRSIRPLGITGALFVALQTVALLRHGDELDWGSAGSIIYVATLVLIGAVSAWTLHDASIGGGRAGPSTGPPLDATA